MHVNLMSSPFRFLESVSNESIFVAITDEHPQTIAVILSCMQPSQVAYIIEALPPERQLAVIRRMAMMRQVEQAVLAIVEKEFYEQVSNQDYVNIGDIDAVAEALFYVEPETASNIMENIGQDDPDLVELVKNQMRVRRERRRGK